MKYIISKEQLNILNESIRDKLTSKTNSIEKQRNEFINDVLQGVNLLDIDSDFLSKMNQNLHSFLVDVLISFINKELGLDCEKSFLYGIYPGFKIKEGLNEETIKIEVYINNIEFGNFHIHLLSSKYREMNFSSHKFKEVFDFIKKRTNK